MKLKIEVWSSNQLVSKEAENLLNEAVVCYKASAYRAGFLFSYLFFQTVLKERILSSRKPDAVPETKWTSIVNNLRNDDKWDEEVFELVKRAAGPVIIFNISDDLRQQVTYWKNRRNDCAHAKSNGIEASHVESLWSFIQYNLPKFVVNGGKSAILEKIRVHFDITLTAPNTEYEYIIQDIVHAVTEQEYPEFIIELNDILGAVYIDPSSSYSSRTINFWLGLFGLSETFDKSLVEFLLENEKLSEVILLSDTSKVTYFQGYDHFIRRLWYKGEIDPSILAALLRNHLVPSDQQEEAITNFIMSSQRIDPENISEVDFQILNDYGFSSIFKRVAFQERRIKQFDWANHSKRWLVIWYLRKYGVDKIIVEAISHTFKGYYPRNLRSALVNLFKDDQNLKDGYIQIAQANDYDLPPTLGF